MGTGEIAGLLAAFMWTISSMYWGRIHLPAMTLNFAKNLVGVVLITVHLLAITSFAGDPVFSASWESWGWLTLSGLIGIVIGDAFYFRSLQILGPRIALMVATTSPIFSVGISWLVIGESLHFAAITGIIMTVGGVMVVVRERQKSNSEVPGLMPGTVTAGIATGIGSAFCQALGGVFSKRGLNDITTGEEICGSVEGTFIRIFIAFVVTAIIVLGRGRIRETTQKIFAWQQLRLIIPATAIGTWLGIWISQIAYQNSEASIAQTLLSTCPLFAIPIVWYSGKYQFTLLSVLGTAIAVVGVFFTVFDWSTVN
ncbi:MAG: DMT family transporter [Planctomycetota bacterium]